MSVCMDVCVFSVEIQTARQVWLKFGADVVLKGGFQPHTQPPRALGASGASAMQIGENIIKQKLQGAPDLVGHLCGPQIWIRKDLGPMSFQSHGHSDWRGVHKIKIVVYFPHSYLVGLDILYPDPRVWRGSKGALEPQPCILAETL